MPYGDSGSASTSSREGIGAYRPYSAPPEEANSTRAPTRRPARPADKSSATITSSPLATSASARCEPIKPAPPVTRTRIATDPHTAPIIARPLRARPPACPAQVSAQVDGPPRGRQRDRPGQGHPARLLQRAGLIVPRHQMGEHQLPRPSLGRVLRRLPCRQVQVSWQTGAVEEGGLAQQQAGLSGPGKDPEHPMIVRRTVDQVTRRGPPGRSAGSARPAGPRCPTPRPPRRTSRR